MEKKRGGSRPGAGRLEIDPELKKIQVLIGIQKWKIDKYGGMLEIKKILLKFVAKLK